MYLLPLVMAIVIRMVDIIYWMLCVDILLTIVMYSIFPWEASISLYIRPPQQPAKSVLPEEVCMYQSIPFVGMIHLLPRVNNEERVLNAP